MNKRRLDALRWMAENRGTLTKIASEIRPRVTQPFVTMVLQGKRKSKDGRVERALRAAGAPI